MDGCFCCNCCLRDASSWKPPISWFEEVPLDFAFCKQNFPQKNQKNSKICTPLSPPQLMRYVTSYVVNLVFRRRFLFAELKHDGKDAETDSICEGWNESPSHFCSVGHHRAKQCMSGTRATTSDPLMALPGFAWPVEAHAPPPHTQKETRPGSVCRRGSRMLGVKWGPWASAKLMTSTVVLDPFPYNANMGHNFSPHSLRGTHRDLCVKTHRGCF